MNWGMTERKEVCQLNQVIHILLIEGQLFILITLRPSFTALYFHTVIFTVPLGVCYRFCANMLTGVSYRRQCAHDICVAQFSCKHLQHNVDSIICGPVHFNHADIDKLG